MTRYVVVTRAGKHPVERFWTVEGAANYIVRETAFGKWTVRAQEANRITAGTPYRELLDHEKKVLEAKLYPALYE